MPADEVHVWRAWLDAPAPTVVAALQALLSEDEEKRARTFYFERDRRRFIVGRGILRQLLAGYVGCEPAQIAFRYGAQGKPALANCRESERIFFNLAHSDDLALFAFTRAGEIGIDLERMRELPDWPSIAELSFSPEELAQLRRRPVERRREEFFHAWTRQEAILKAAGTGLGLAVPPSAGNRSRPAEGATAPLSAFDVSRIETEPGFAAALAVRRTDPTSHLS